MAEEIKEQKLQTMALDRITNLLEAANTVTGGSNAEEAKERAEQKAARSEANQERREEARQRIQQIVENNKVFKGITAGFKGLQSGFLKIGAKLTDGFKSLAAKGKEVAGSAFDILKKVAFVAGLGAILAFLNSPYFVQLKEYVVNVVAPALADFYNNALKPAFEKFMAFVIPIIKDVFNFFVEEVLPVFKRISAFLFNEVLPILGVALVNTIDNLKQLFGDIVGAFDKIISGDFLGGISDLILGIGGFILKQLDVAATALFNIIASIFGFDETESIAGSIGKFFTDIYDTVVGFFTGIFDYFRNIFAFDEEGFSFANLFDIIYAPVNIAVNLIKDLFSIGDPDVPFKFSEFIGGILQKVGDFFRNLFDIDFKALASKFLPESVVESLFATDEDKRAKRKQEINDEIAMEEARIARSQAGENEFTGSEEMGIRGSNTRIARLKKERSKLALEDATPMDAAETQGLGEKPVEVDPMQMSDEEQVELAKNIRAENRRLELSRARIERKKQRMRGDEIASNGPVTAAPPAPVTQVNMQNIDNSDKSSSSTVTSSPIVDQNPMVKAALGVY